MIGSSLGRFGVCRLCLPLVLAVGRASAGLALLLAGSPFGLSLSLAAQYQIEPLGSLGGNYSRAMAISNSNLVAGYAYTPDSVEHAFLWQNGSMSDLGTLGGATSRAYDVNQAGQVAGWAANTLGQARPIVWNGAAIQELPTLGGPAGAVRGINDSGHAVGNAYLTSSAYHAALWHDGTVSDLGTLGGTYSIAYNINRDGVIAGAAYDASSTQWACLWSGGAIQNLGMLPGATASSAQAVNDQGQAILWNYGLAHAALWEDDRLTDLGTFGGTESWAYGLNNAGQVVGWAELPSGIYHGFVWRDANGNGFSDPGEMIDLGTLGGQFSSAYGVNDAGVIVGYAQDAAGYWRAVEWVPVPEPMALGLLIAGLGLIVCRRRPARRQLGR